MLNALAGIHAVASAKVAVQVGDEDFHIDFGQSHFDYLAGWSITTTFPTTIMPTCCMNWRPRPSAVFAVIYRRWQYVLIPHDAIAENMPLAGLAKHYGVAD